MGNGTIGFERLLPPPRPSSALLSDFMRAEYDESTGLLRNVRSEAHTPDSPQSMSQDLDDELPDSAMLDNITSSSPMVMPEMRKSRARSIQSNGDVGSKRGSLTYRSLERLNRGPNRVSVYGEQAQIQIPHPFRGAQSSQMICTGCGYKSVVRYDKFDSISLPLPENTNIGLSLGHLLSEYVASENLNDVTCESCNETCQHTKSVTFAKVINQKIRMFSFLLGLIGLIMLFFISYQHAYAFIFHEIHGCQLDNHANDKMLYIFRRVYRWHRTVLYNPV